ncbi:MAG: hypothetical protein EAX96_03890 [Candidatus Lokiarchaeota archaeon]|nr:hypothetical protein [Candidatus Lokiarchaeota archaeon]
MKEVENIIEKIDTLKKQFEENRNKIGELDSKIREIVSNSDNMEILENISNRIVHLKKINEDIDDTILDLERKLAILNRYELENL